MQEQKKCPIVGTEDNSTTTLCVEQKSVATLHNMIQKLKFVEQKYLALLTAEIDPERVLTHKHSQTMNQQDLDEVITIFSDCVVANYFHDISSSFLDKKFLTGLGLNPTKISNDTKKLHEYIRNISKHPALHLLL